MAFAGYLYLIFWNNICHRFIGIQKKKLYFFIMVCISLVCTWNTPFVEYNFDLRISVFTKYIAFVFGLAHCGSTIGFHLLWHIVFVLYSTRRFVFSLALCYFVLVFFSPLSIAITTLGEERANLSAFRLFDLRLFGFVCFLFLLVSGKVYGL